MSKENNILQNKPHLSNLECGFKICNMICNMKNMKFKKSRLIPNLSDNQNKKLFRAMNIALIIGGLSLILTFLYMIVNLDQADKILINCLPGFVFGIILMILYAIGYQKITQNKNNRDLRKHFHSTD